MSKKSSLDTMLADAQARVLEIADEIEALGAVAAGDNRELNDVENETITALGAESEKLLEKIPSLEQAVAIRDKAQAGRIPDPLPPEDVGLMISTNPNPTAFSLPATVAKQRTKVFDSNAEAYAMGNWLAAIGGNQAAMKFCRERKIGTAFGAMDTSNTSAVVPVPLAATIIRLVEEYGVFRRNARPAIMTSGTLDVPVYTDGLTVYYPAEGTQITASDISVSQTQLTAHKYACMSLLSTELSEDSIISMADLITVDIAQQFAWAEDVNSFLGDGVGPPAITGIKSALQAGAKVIVTGAAATAWDQLTLDDLHAAVGKLPLYSGIMPKWYMSSYAYHTAVLPLLVALGGTDMRQFEAGGQMMLLGFPVEFTQVLPGATTTTDDLLITFGDLNMGAYSGQRRQLTIRVLNERYADSDQIGIQATMRADSNIHSVGDATTAGAIVGIYAGGT